MKIAILFFLLPLSANASFVCDGRRLVSNHGATYNFSSEQECNIAASNSKNGFTCDGRKLITLNGQSVYLNSGIDCETAVRNSK